MTLKMREPFIIGPRLLPAIRINDATLSGPEGDGRWFLDGPWGEHEITDFHPGAGCDVQRMFAALLGFMDACGESWRYDGADGENSHLFPPEVAEWCAANGDSISILEYDLEEGPNLIEIEP